MARPDVTFVFQQLSQHVVAPREAHWDATHYLLRYLKLAPSTSLFISSSIDLRLTTYCDADWASSSKTRRSLTGYSLAICLFLGKLRSRPLFLAPRLRLNIGALLPLFVSYYGSCTYFMILVSLFPFLSMFGVIIRQPSILLPTPFFMSVPSTWILIVILCEISLNLALFILNIFLLSIRWHICLQRL